MSEQPPKDERNAHEITESNRLTYPLTFDGQMERMTKLELLSLGHQEAMKTHDPRFVYLQEIVQCLQTVKTRREMDMMPFTLEEWEKMDALVRQKIAELDIDQADLDKSVATQSQGILKEPEPRESIPATLRKIWTAMAQIRASFNQKT